MINSDISGDNASPHSGTDPKKRETFFEFLDETQYIFAIWGVLGAFSLYLLEFSGRFSEKGVELLNLTHSSAATQSQLNDYYANAAATILFSIAAAASFVLFLLISFALIRKCQSYLEIHYIKSIKTKKIEISYITFIEFITFFMVIVIAISAFTLIKFFYILVQFEYLVLLMILLFVGVAYLNIRIIKKVSGLQQNANEDIHMTPEEIAKRTMGFQAYQLGILVGVSFAAFIGSFFTSYGPIVALIGGISLGIISVCISFWVIKKLGF